VLKLSRTIANLAGLEEITRVILAESLQYKPKLELMLVVGNISRWLLSRFDDSETKMDF
jgi:hypothetical protein